MATTTATEITNQDKIRYLKRYIWIDKDIDFKFGEILKWRGMLEKVTATYSSQPQGGGSIYNKTEEIVAKIIDLENRMNVEIDKLIEIREEIERIIGGVEDERERTLLRYRYLQGQTFEWIAAEMNYSWRHIHRLHSKSLENVRLS